jgi:hypothetical protein
MDPTTQLRYRELLGSLSPANLARLPLQVQLYASSLESLAEEWGRGPFGVEVELETFRKMMPALTDAALNCLTLQEEVSRLEANQHSFLRGRRATKLLRKQAELKKLEEHRSALYSAVLVEHHFLLNCMELDSLIQAAGLQYWIDRVPEGEARDHVTETFRLVDKQRLVVTEEINSVFRRVDTFYTTWENIATVPKP